MIKNFKIFEDNYNKFKPGDVVVCNRNKDNYIAKYGEKYIVKEVNSMMMSLSYYKVDRFLRVPYTKKIKYFFINNFLSEDEWNAKKYNI